MTNEELTLYNIGENLDSLMTLDPRGRFGIYHLRLCTVALEAAGDGRHGVFYDAGALSD